MTEQQMTEFPAKRTVSWIDDESGEVIGRAEYTLTSLIPAMLARARAAALLELKMKWQVRDLTTQDFSPPALDPTSKTRTIPMDQFLGMMRDIEEGR
jgi:hypothetical protein